MDATNSSEWKPVAGAPAEWDMKERKARDGEVCTCGRPAIKVYLTEGHEVPYCGIPGR